MSRSVGSAVENNFIKGVVSEFSGLNFPESACTDALNVLFNEKGEIKRRPGIDFETDYTFIAADTSAANIQTSFHWKTAGGQSENSFIVQQVGRYLYFFRTNSALSSNQASFTFDLMIYATNNLRINTEACQYANGSGRLYVVHPFCEPFYIEYVPETDSITHNFYYVRVRDFTVLEDGLAVQEGTSAYIPAHQYNIYNAGWTTFTRDSWVNSRGYYPSKSEIWWYYRDATGTYTLEYNMHPDRTGKFPFFGNSLAPRGYYILNEFFQDRTGASGISGLPSKSSGTARPGAVAFMNGRVFLGGVNAKGYNGRIYFSQILKNSDEDLRFYQNGDPTSELNAQLLPNDGGVIVIPEAGQILFMYQVKNAMMVFADNGVWSISGSEGVGFTATDFSVERISETSAISASSFGIVETTPIWWNLDGIFTVQGNPMGSLEVVSLTKNTIQSIYDVIPSEAKKYAKATYNKLTKEVFWLYSDDEGGRVYNKILVLRVPTQAFYFYEMTGSPEILDLISYTGAGTTVDQDIVLDNNGDVVVDEADAPVTIDAILAGSTLTNIKFLTKPNTNLMTYSDLINSTHRDWTSSGLPVYYDSYAESGYRVRGEAQKKSQVPYITVHTKYEEDNSCFMQAIWDYRNSNLTGGVTNPQQVCKSDSARDYQSRRLKVRGNGLAVQFKFYSVEDKPFTLIGWATSESVNDRT